jgi:hypothetical protein
MTQSKAEMIVARLLSSAAKVKYGTVSVSVRLHDGRAVEISYLTAEQTREPKAKLDKEK